MKPDTQLSEHSSYTGLISRGEGAERIVGKVGRAKAQAEVFELSFLWGALLPCVLALGPRWPSVLPLRPQCAESLAFPVPQGARLLGRLLSAVPCEPRRTRMCRAKIYSRCQGNNAGTHKRELPFWMIESLTLAQLHHTKHRAQKQHSLNGSGQILFVRALLSLPGFVSKA